MVPVRSKPHHRRARLRLQPPAQCLSLLAIGCLIWRVVPTPCPALCAVPYNHINDMATHMKTTLNIDDTVMAELKREAVRQGRTMSELVETALRLLLHAPRKRKGLPDLPTFDGGEPQVDIADRNALYDAMEGR